MFSKYRIDVFIAGAEKAGTTSLGHYIAQHSKIFTHLNKKMGRKMIAEFSGFNSELGYPNQNFVKIYFNTFQRLPQTDEIVLAKNIELMTNEVAALKLKKHSPDCKILVSIRNPVDRAYSSFYHQRYRGEENYNCFERAIEYELYGKGRRPSSISLKYLYRGLYAEQIQMLHNIFDRENVHIVIFEEMKRDTTKTIEDILKFINLNICPIDVNFISNKGKTVIFPFLSQFVYSETIIKKIIKQIFSYKIRYFAHEWIKDINSTKNGYPPMNKSTRDILLDYFRPHNEKLLKLIGKNIDHWNK